MFKNILIVGKDACAYAALYDMGCQVKRAEGGKEEAEILAGGYDLVLLDTTACSHRALLGAIRADFPDLPVIVVTADRDAAAVIDVLRRGAFDVLLRPFTDAALLDAIERAAQRSEVFEQKRTYQQTLEQMVIDRTEMLHESEAGVEPLYDLVLETLGDALDLKDSETEGHSRRVTAYSIVLARAMGLSPAQVKIIARGAYLHDIGKLAIPDDILHKPGRLSQEQKEVMREHCERGYRVLSKAPFLAQAAEIVFSHQEFFDGTGYPRGLQGEDIPFGARIFSVTDAMDAMTSDRPYRQASSFEAAQQEIERCSGTQFDPDVVAAYLEIPCALWRGLRDDVNSQISAHGSGLAAGLNQAGTGSEPAPLA